MYSSVGVYTSLSCFNNLSYLGADNLNHSQSAEEVAMKLGENANGDYQEGSGLAIPQEEDYVEGSGLGLDKFMGWTIILSKGMENILRYFFISGLVKYEETTQPQYEDCGITSIILLSGLLFIINMLVIALLLILFIYRYVMLFFRQCGC